MLIQLTKALGRRTAGAVTVFYLLCVLAPAAVFAFGDGSRAAHCLTDNHHGLQAAQVHEQNGHEHEGGKPHVHTDGTQYDHSKAPDGKSSSGQCCGLFCLTGLPSGVSDAESPGLPGAVGVFANQAEVAGNIPERLYRPPNSPLSL